MAMECSGAGQMLMVQQQQQRCNGVKSGSRRWHGRRHRSSRSVQLNCFPRHPAGGIHVRLIKLLAHFLQWLEYVQVFKRSPQTDQIGSRGAGQRPKLKKRSCSKRTPVLEQQQKQHGGATRRQANISNNHHEDDAIADCLEFIKRSWGTV